MNSDPQKHIKYFNCSFCGQKNVSIHSNHPCIQKVFEVLNLTAAPKEASTLFNEIENLVFQGGGVKGVSYLGVLHKNEDRTFQHHGFLNGAKRVAGTSAGSIMALYMALNMNATAVQGYLETDYKDLLDEEPTLTVKVPGKSCCYIPTTIQKKFTRKKIVLSIVNKIDQIKEDLKHPQREKRVLRELTEILTDMLIYIGKHFGMLGGVIAWWESGVHGGQLAKWLMEQLSPDPAETEIQSRTNLSEKMFSGPQSPQEQINHVDNIAQPGQHQEGPRPEVVNGRAHSQKAIEHFHNCMDDAIKNVKHKKELHHPKKSNSKNGSKKNVEMTPEGLFRPLPFLNINENNTPVLEDPQGFLDGVELANSIGELIGYVIDMKENDMGLFAGKIIKEQLISAPIRDRLGLDNPTFEEFANAIDKKTGLKVKELYITAFNVQLERTEVFSAIHTPKVLVADAVRASMSIPVFFEPVEIRERTTRGDLPRRIYPDHIPHGEAIRYMDGGILDNYPIWIFDDLRFCVQGYEPTLRHAVENPRTLGFRILDEQTIDVYVRPYRDMGLKNKMREIGSGRYGNSFRYLLMHLVGGFTSHEENVYLNEGNWPRSVYINNLNVSAIAFNMDPRQKELLVKEGEKAVEFYVERAKHGHFANEGQKYP